MMVPLLLPTYWISWEVAWINLLLRDLVIVVIGDAGDLLKRQVGMGGSG